VLVWREKPVLAQAELGPITWRQKLRTIFGHHLPIFSTQHTQTTIVLTSKMKKKKGGWHTDVLGIVVVTLPPFDPGSSRGATQCIEIQTQEKQRFPFSDILLIHCDSQ